MELPDIEDYAPVQFDPDDPDSEPSPPLNKADEWVHVDLDLGDGLRPYTRDTNVMPQWAGSSWYELRYTDPHNAEQFCDPRNEAYWMGPRPAEHGAEDPGGVDLYVGGVEHAVLHLLYSRFWHKVLYDLGHVTSREPYRRLVNQGYIQAFAYTDARGSYVPAADVVERGDKFFLPSAGGEIEQLGMPVDPGNLLLIGCILDRDRKVHVLGAPGCARSPKENGFDWVLHRLLAGIDVTSRDIRRMGAGGLLMEIVDRGQLRAPDADHG